MNNITQWTERNSIPSFNFYSNHLNNASNVLIISPQSRTRPSTSFRSWPNTHTIFTVTNILNNIVFKRTQDQFWLILNIGVRCYQLITTKNISVNKLKVIMRILGIVTILFSKKGWLLATCIDFIGEGINYYKYRSLLNNCKDIVLSNRRTFPSSTLRIQLDRIDPLIPENALLILNISNEKKVDIAYINKQYRLLGDIYNIKKSKVSPPLAFAIGEIIEDIEIAYKTIIAQQPSDKNN
jgi:hypothetical protein